MLGKIEGKGKGVTEDKLVGWQESITEMYWERISVIFSRVSDVCG